MTNTKPISALLIAALLASAGTTAYAQNATARDERRAAMFAELDADNDGSVTKDEFAARTNHFARADTNGDGQLTVEEIVAASEERATRRAERIMARFDENEDGMLTEDELSSRRDPARMFERLDANNDGSVSAEEFAEARMGDRDGNRGGHWGSRRHGDR